MDLFQILKTITKIIVLSNTEVAKVSIFNRAYKKNGDKRKMKELL